MVIPPIRADTPIGSEAHSLRIFIHVARTPPGAHLPGCHTRPLMKKRPVTIYDIAQLLQLSPSTISRGLRNDHRINHNTKRLIQETARELNYQPNRIAAGLRGGTTRTIGIIVPRIGRYFFANAISGIERVARARGFQVIITQSNEDARAEWENVAALTAARVDGIIASVTVETTDPAPFQNLRKRQIPLVFFDRYLSGVPAHRVVLDDERCAFDAVNHLYQQGARRIAYLGGPEALNIYRNRYAGYRRALEVNGLPLNPDHIDLDCLKEEPGLATAQRMLQHPEPPDAFFCASDYSALGVITYCREFNVPIPGQVKVVSFANEPFTRIMSPQLSSVDQFSETMGMAAADLLFNQIDRTDTGEKGEEVVIPGALIVRTSSLDVAS